MKTKGKDNGVFKYEIKSEWEKMLNHLFSLCVTSGMNSPEVEFAVIQCYCEEYGLNTIEMLSLTKHIVYEVYK